jgi:hypothetical protein
MDPHTFSLGIRRDASSLDVEQGPPPESSACQGLRAYHPRPSEGPEGWMAGRANAGVAGGDGGAHYVELGSFDLYRSLSM